jgi:hypothetical protein
MAKKGKKTQSIAAVAQQLGLPQAAARQVVAHVKKNHVISTQTRTKARQAKHKATLYDFQVALGKFGVQHQQVQGQVDKLMKELKNSLQVLKGQFANTCQEIMADDIDNPGGKPDPTGSGRP